MKQDLEAKLQRQNANTARPKQERKIFAEELETITFQGNRATNKHKCQQDKITHIMSILCHRLHRQKQRKEIKTEHNLVGRTFAVLKKILQNSTLPFERKQHIADKI